MIRLRLARFVSDERYGCPVNSVSVTTHLPSSPRSAAACAAADSSPSVSPSSSATSSKTTARSLVSFSRFFSNVVVSVERRWLSAVSVSLAVVVEPGAGVGHLAVVALDEVALLGLEAELVELVVDGLDAPVELRRRAGSSPGAPTSAARASPRSPGSRASRRPTTPCRRCGRRRRGASRSSRAARACSRTSASSARG